MRIAIFADMHGNQQALEAILNDTKKKNIDEIISLGDTICLGPYVGSCLDLLMANNVKMVVGNHELYILKGTEIDDDMSELEIAHHNYVFGQLKDKHMDYLRSCPMSITKQIGNKKVVFQHFLFKDNPEDDYPYADLDIIRNTQIKDIMQMVDADIMFIGHEHKDFLVELNNKKLCDVGSSGCRKDDMTYYTILTIDDNDIKIERVTLKYDRKALEEEFSRIDFPDKDNVFKKFFS